jgi:hypothetical protein
VQCTATFSRAWKFMESVPLFNMRQSSMELSPEGAAMSDDHIPHDALFIQWGRFKAGASGRTAILALVGLIGAAGFVKMMGWL